MLAAVRLIAGVSSTHVLERVDALGGLLDLAANDLGDQLLGELSQSAGAGLALHDLGHLLADGPDLRRSGVGGLLDLVGPALGEADGEEAEQVVVGGLDDNVGLDEGLPLADERAELVGGEVEAVEVGQAVLALDLVDAELDLAEGVVLVLLEIGEGNLEYPSLEGVVGVLQTGGAVDEGLADTACGQYACAVQIAAAACWASYSLIAKVPGALTLYQSFFAKVSVFFLRPFLPFERRLFFPTAMVTIVVWASCG
jgi:hypothetical protein